MAKQAGEDLLADRLIWAAVRLTRTLRALTKSSALTGPQISALSVIVFSGRIAARDLARLEEVTPATISRLIADLEAEGIVRREADKRDARVQWISATPKGARLITEGHRRRLAPLAKAIAALSRKERQTIDEAIELIEGLTKAAASDAEESKRRDQPRASFKSRVIASR